MRSEQSRRRIGARRRRSRLIMLATAGAAVLATIAVGSTGAYFTSSSSLQASGAVASLPAVSGLSVTRAGTGAANGQTTNLSWTAPDPATIGDATPAYTVKRNTVDDFGANSGATTLQSGLTGTTFADTAAAGASLANREVTALTANAGYPNNSIWALIGGKAFGWGDASSGGPAFSGLPSQFMTNITEPLTIIAGGVAHACAVGQSNTIYCVGGNAAGQLGDGTTTNSPSTGVAIVDRNGVFVDQGRITQIIAGSAFSCALTSTGTIGCWGQNNNSQLGQQGTTANSSYPIKVGATAGALAPVFTDFKPVQIAASGNTACALKGSAIAADGSVTQPPQGRSVACWGYNQNFSTGQASGTTVPLPTDVPDPNGVLVGATRLTLGEGTGCVVNGQTGRPNIACWGEGSQGRLGDGTSDNTPTPRTIQWASGASTATQSAFVDVTISSYHACGATATAYTCWGFNREGQLGRGAASGTGLLLPGPMSTATAALGADGIRVIRAGTNGTCIASTNGGLACWGAGVYTAQAASGAPAQHSPIVAKMSATAGDVLMPTQRVSVHKGSTSMHLNAAVINGYPHYWGPGLNMDTSNPPSPVLAQRNVPSAIPDAPFGTRLLAVGMDFICGVAGDNGLWCVGENGSGQLGDGGTTDRTAAKTVTDTANVFANKRIVAITALENSTCALAEDGTVGCWGSNANGELARPSGTATSAVPVRSVDPAAAGVLAAATKATSLASGSFHVCATRIGSGVVCWGGNDQRQLGGDSASPARSYEPVLTADAGGALAAGPVKSISADWKSTCIIASDGAPYCWGRNAWGETGQTPSGETAVPKPARVPGSGTGYMSVSNGTRHGCASTTTSVDCWGNNGAGELGRNGTSGTGLADAQTIGAVNDANGFLAGGIAAISTSWRTTCIVTTAQALACWGYNGYGSAAQNTTTNVLTPTVAKISATSGLTNVAGRGTRTCTTGASLVNNNDECTLTPSQRYFYEVTYSVPNATKWVSRSAAMLRDGYATCAEVTASQRIPAATFLYALDEAAGASVAADALGRSGAQGARFGDTAVETSGPIPCGAQRAYRPDGTGDWITARYPGAATGRPSTLSTSIWFKTTIAGGVLMQFSDSATGDAANYDPSLYIDSGGQITLAVWGGSAANTVRSGRVVTDGKWHQVVVTYTTGMMRMYLDGAEVGSNSTSTSAATHSGWWRIGGGKHGGYPNAPSTGIVTGALSRAGVWPTVLSADEVFAQYSAARPR